MIFYNSFASFAYLSFFADKSKHLFYRLNSEEASHIFLYISDLMKSALNAFISKALKIRLKVISKTYMECQLSSREYL